MSTGWNARLTRRAAYIAALEGEAERNQEIMEFFRLRDDYGSSDDEGSISLAMNLDTFKAARNGLFSRGLLVDTGMTRLTRHNCPATVWRISTDEEFDEKQEELKAMTEVMIAVAVDSSGRVAALPLREKMTSRETFIAAGIEDGCDYRDSFIGNVVYSEVKVRVPKPRDGPIRGKLVNGGNGDDGGGAPVPSDESGNGG